KKRKEEERKLRLEQVIQERAKKKEELLKFLTTKKNLPDLEKRKQSLLAEVFNSKKLIERRKQAEVKQILTKVRQEEAQKEKALLERQKIIQKKIESSISNLTKIASAIEKEPERELLTSRKNISKFIIEAKKIPKKKPPKVVPEKVVPVKKVKPVVYKEPFQLGIFLRRNAFKFVFLILLLGWILEFLMYMRKLVSPEERLKMIVGEIKEPREKPKEKITDVEEEEKFVYYSKEKIDIEGKRDPFSTSRLTMEIMEKPVPTKIIFVKKPEVISIIKSPKFVSILKPEEKIEKLELSEKISSLEKPRVLKTEEIKIESKIPELPKVKKPEVTPFIMPEKECPLICRGRMILEGVEYFFIEGEKRTYRATIGDVVEGYKILKKEKNKLYLSKEGIIYEIDAP
ncbi:MAG: hypothetical protein ABIM58_04870, partial [candidate division WOR-3 bacterium]